MKLTRREWRKLPKERRSIGEDGVRRVLRLDPDSGATVLEPVELTDEDEYLTPENYCPRPVW